MPQCRGCGAEIVFFSTKGGFMPVEAGMRRVYLATDIDKPSGPLRPRPTFAYLEHYSRCPQKAMFKKPEGLPEK